MEYNIVHIFILREVKARNEWFNKGHVNGVWVSRNSVVEKSFILLVDNITRPRCGCVDAWKIGQSFSYCQNSRSDRVRSCVYGQSFSHWQNNWVIVCEHREEERISGRVLKQYAKQIKSTASASNCYNSRLTVDCRVTWVTRQDLWKQSS